ncbi:hypothetical protein ABT246_25620 [Streptomyces sp. NPDC001553]|uniref:hypothetical protein n=1 Tax=Streptomyces sp. NPDC001553 TaxID=3154385 RepID=UPI00331DE87D
MPTTRTRRTATRTTRTKQPAKPPLGLPRHRKNSRLSDKERLVFAQREIRWTNAERRREIVDVHRAAGPAGAAAPTPGAGVTLGGPPS